MLVVTPSPAAQPIAPRAWTVDALFNPAARYLALFAMSVSFFFPVSGLGVDLCLLHAATGLPCPGCGMSRALAAISQGDFSAAMGLNPFAFFAWPTFLVLAMLTLMPARVRRHVEARVRRSPRAGKVYELVFWSFLGFGLIRLGVFLVLAERFP